MSRIEWEEYLKDIEAIQKFSNDIGDTWKVICVVSCFRVLIILRE